MTMIVVVTYQDGSTENLRSEGPLQWDVQEGGHLVAWNDTGDVVAERADVVTAIYDRSLT